MIELIFAIVIIGITVISLPMMTQINERGVSENVKQEAIFIASAKLMQVLSFAWDKNAVDANNTFDSARVVHINGTSLRYRRADINGNEDNSSIFRVGHVRQDLHRRFFNYNDNNYTHNAPTPLAVGVEDQADGVITKDGRLGYKSNHQTTVRVISVNDTANVLSITPAGATNLKMVEVSVQDDSSGAFKDVVVLRSFVANIGEVDYFSRLY